MFCLGEHLRVYLGHTLSRHGIAKGTKVDAILQMEPPTNLAELRSFIGSVQFYGKFIKDLATTLEPLTLLTRKDVHWHWRKEQQTAFQHLKDVLCSDVVLAHFDPSLEVGMSCDASSVGVGAVLFHRYPDGGERPIAYASKKMTPTQQRYSQIQREALVVIFGLNKFHKFLYGRHFYLITDHKPLLALFGPNKGIRQHLQPTGWQGGLCSLVSMTIALNSERLRTMEMQMLSAVFQ